MPGIFIAGSLVVGTNEFPNKIVVDISLKLITGWWFQIFFIFTPILGRNGLKPPSSLKLKSTKSLLGCFSIANLQKLLYI